MDYNILVPIAQGTEETEAVTIIDLLRRAGLKVIIAAQNDIVTCSRGVKVIPDILFRDIEDVSLYDAVILPGGAQGTEHLMNSDTIEMILNHMKSEGKLIGAICAAPAVLSRFKVIDENDHVTSHPSVKNELRYYNYIEENVVVSGNLITSRGVGTAIDFALVLIAKIVSEEKAAEIADSILYHYD